MCLVYRRFSCDGDHICLSSELLSDPAWKTTGGIVIPAFFTSLTCHLSWVTVLPWRTTFDFNPLLHLTPNHRLLGVPQDATQGNVHDRIFHGETSHNNIPLLFLIPISRQGNSSFQDICMSCCTIWSSHSDKEIPCILVGIQTLNLLEEILVFTLGKHLLVYEVHHFLIRWQD